MSTDNLGLPTSLDEEEKNRSALEEAERAASAARAPLPSADEPESDLSAPVDPVADASDVPRDEPAPAPEPSPAFADEQPVPQPDERPEESADSSPATSEPEEIQPELDSENGWEEGWEDREDRRPGEDDWTTLRRHNLADIGNELAVIANAARSNETVDRTFRSIDGFGGAGADEMLDILANGTDRFLDRDDTAAQDLYKTLERATDGIYTQLGGKIEDFWIGNRRVVHDDYAFGVVRDQQDVDDRRQFMDEQDARARQMAKEVAFLKQNHDRSLVGRMLWHVRNDEDWDDERFGVFDGTNKLTLNEIEKVAGMSGFKEAKNHVARERFDTLAKAVHERYLKERGERSAMEAAADNFRGGLVELGTMEENLRNLLLNGGSGEAFMRRARELKDVEELNAAETPTGRDFTEIGGPLEALGWMFQQFSRLAPQMIAQFGIALGTGGAGNLAAGAAGRIGASAATKAAIRSGFSRVGGYATTVALDVADVTGQLAGEAAERGQEGIDLGELALVSVPFVGADLYGSIGRGVRRAAGKAAGDIARDMTRSAQVYTARGFWHDVLRGSTRVLKDAGLEGATEASQDWFVRLGNLGKNGTLALAGQGEESFDVFDAMLGSAETFFAAAASGGAGAIGSYANFGRNSSFTGEYWRQKRQFERSAPRVDRYMGWEEGTTARIVRSGKTGADVESARNGYGSVLAEIMRDQAAGNATRLDALDATLLGQAIVAGQAIKDLESVSRNAERSLAAVRAGAQIEKKDKDGNPTGEFYTAEELLRFKEQTDHALENARGVKSQKRDNMGDNAKGILDALDATIGGPTLAEGVRMQRERVSGGAEADPIRMEGFDVPVVPPSVDERTGVVTTVYMEREQEGSSHRMQIVETLDPDSGEIVYRVKNLRSDARPADAASEFSARDFGGDDKAALAAALDFARDYADWSAVGAAANEAFDRAAASYVEANYPGRLAICADNETELFAKLADAGIDLASGDYGTDMDERLRSLFHGSQESALTVPPLADRDGPVFSVIVRARNATPANLAATLDHETMHVDFARRLQEAVSRRENPETGRLELANKPLLDELFAGWKKPDGTAIDPAELSPVFLQRRVRVALLGLDRDGRGRPLSQEAVLAAMADDEAQAREEELYAYATESVNAGASEGPGLVAGLVHPFRARKMRILRQTHPELAKFAGAYVAGRLGAFTGGMSGGVVTDMWEDTAATDDEIADYLFRLRQPPASDYAPNPHADDPEGARRALGAEPSAPDEGRTSESVESGAPAPAERNYASREEIVADLAAARENMAGLRRANAESSQIDEAAGRVRRLQTALREWDESHREAPSDTRQAPRGAPAEAQQPQRPAPAETSPQENRTGSEAPEEPAPSATPEPAPAEPRPIPKGDGKVVVAGKAVRLENADNTESYEAVPIFIDLGDGVDDTSPDFPVDEAQNRSKESKARDVKAAQIATNLSNGRLLNPHMRTLMGGAQVFADYVADDGRTIENLLFIGNTRNRALKILERAGRLGSYYDDARALAKELGADISKMARPQFGFKLVKPIRGKSEMAKLTRSGNTSDVAALSDASQGIDDARGAIKENPTIKGFGRPLLDLFEIGKNDQVSDAFLLAFAQAAGIQPADAAYFAEVNGKTVPNGKLRDRAERAMIAYALDGNGVSREDLERALNLLFVKENGFTNIRKGLAKAAAKLARAFAKNPEFSLAKDFFDGLNAYNTARVRVGRKEINSVSEHFNQESIDFGEGGNGGISDEARQIALLFDRFKNSYTKVAKVFDAYADSVYRPANPADGQHEEFLAKANAETGEQDLFGGGPVVTDKRSLLAKAVSTAAKTQEDEDALGLGLRSRNGGSSLGAARARNKDDAVQIASHERRQVLADAERKFGKRPIAQVPPNERIQTVFVQGRRALGANGVRPSAALPESAAEVVYRYDGDGRVSVLARLKPEYPGLDSQRYMFGSREADEAAKRRERRTLGRIVRRNNGNGRFDGLFQPLLLGPGPRARNGEFSPQTPEFRRQLDEVIERYKGTPQWLKAPNGQDSVLAATPDYGPLLWATVRTQSFKDWFGDWENDPENASKVVDENGEPLVMYHGTPGPEISAFANNRALHAGNRHGGYYFTPALQIAQDYAKMEGNEVGGDQDIDKLFERYYRKQANYNKAWEAVMGPDFVKRVKALAKDLSESSKSSEFPQTAGEFISAIRGKSDMGTTAYEAMEEVATRGFFARGHFAVEPDEVEHYYGIRLTADERSRLDAIAGEIRAKAGDILARVRADFDASLDLSGTVMPVFLNIRNPLYVDTDQTRAAAVEDFGGEDKFEALENDRAQARVMQRYNRRLLEAGNHDGFFEVGKRPWEMYEIVVPHGYESNIKSIFNSGAFSPATSAVRARNSVSVAAAGRLGITNEEAERLEREGYFPDEIFRRTRWYRGVKDDEWRYELEPVQLRPWLTAWGDAPVRRAGGKWRAIADIIGEDSPFLRAYPAARNITVEIKENKDGGEGELVGDRITVWGRKGQTLAEFAQDKGEDGLLNSLVHELQHWVQNQEGWPEGSSPGNFRSDRKSRRLRQAENERSQAYWNARRLAVQHGYDTSPDAVEDRNRRGVEEAVVADMEALLPEQGETAAEEEPWVADLRERVGLYRRAVANVKRIADEDGYQTAWDKYNRVAGEVESRNAGSRAAMSSEEAAENPPWTTMDVSPLSQTIVRDGRVAAARATEPAGRQKQAGVSYPDARAEIEALDLRPGLGTSAEVRARNRDEIMGVLSRKRPDLDAGAVADEILKFATPKERKIALHWVVRGGLALPQDAYKVADAISTVEQAKRDLGGARETRDNAEKTLKAATENIRSARESGDPRRIARAEDRLNRANARFVQARDLLERSEGKSLEPFDYKSPDELLLALKEFSPSGRPIDPATVPELSDPRDEGDGIVSYLVQDDRQGQAAMRRVIDTHWGENANPWCLLAKKKKWTHVELTNDYDAYQEMERWWAQLPHAERVRIAGDRADEESVMDADPASQYYVDNVVDNPVSLDTAWTYWQHYSVLPKRVAFKDGRLLAFMATDQTSDVVSQSWKEREYQDFLDSWDSFWQGEFFPDRDTPPSMSEWFDLAMDGALGDYKPQYGGSEEWWDRQDVSHPDLDWAREGSEVRSRNADETMAARLGLGNADEARRMEREGASRLDIWRRTGWWKRPEDGMWRIELPPLKFKPGAFERLEAAIRAGGGHALKAPKFSPQNLPTRADYDAAPAPVKSTIRSLLRQDAVTFAAAGVYHDYREQRNKTNPKIVHESWYDRRSFTDGNGVEHEYAYIGYGEDNFRKYLRNAADEWMSSHGEQAEILGGMSSEIVPDALRMFNRFVSDILTPQGEKSKVRLGLARIPAADRPMTLGEILADDDPVLRALPQLRSFPIRFISDTGRYGGWADDTEIALNTSFTRGESGTRNTAEALAHEIQHKVQDAVGFMRGVSPDAVKRAREDRSYRFDPWTNEQLRGDENLTPEQVYMGWGGEVEARAVEARMHLTDEQRKEIPPWVTEEVVREDKFRKRSDYSYAAQKRAMEEMQWVEESSVNDPNGPQYRPLSGEQAQTERRQLGNPEQLTFDFIPPPNMTDEERDVIAQESVSDAENLAGAPAARARGKEYDPRSLVPRVRGGWNQRKILDYLRHYGSLHGVATASKLIAEFDSVEELKAHMFYHGTTNAFDHMRPSITKSERWVEQFGGGGYGQRYWGISLTDDKKTASIFSGPESYVRIYPVILAKNANVVDRADWTDAADAEDHIVELWNEGVDAVRIGGGEKELLVLNPRAICNIGTSDFYQAYRLGSDENPINIKNDEQIARMFEVAKGYVGYRPEERFGKPPRPSLFVAGSDEFKPDEQRNREREEYERAVASWRNTDQGRAAAEYEDLVRSTVRFRNGGEPAAEPFSTEPEDIGRRVMGYNVGDRPPDLTPVAVTNSRTGKPERAIAFPGDRPEGYVPSRIGYAYKLMEQWPDGSLHALFANVAETVPQNEWMFAAGFPLTDRNVKGMKLRQRYAWHLGFGLPTAPHLMSSKDYDRGYPTGAENGKGHPKGSRRVWVRVAFDASNDWNAAMDRVSGREGGDPYGLIPFGGYYGFIEGNKSNWILSSAVKFDKVLSEDERQEILRGAGFDERAAWEQRHGGKKLGAKNQASKPADKLAALRELRDRIARSVVDNPEIRARNGQAYYGELFPEMGGDAANRPFAFTQAEILARMRGLIPGYDYKPEHIEEIEYIRKGMEILERDPDAVDNIRRKTVGETRPAPLSPDEQYVLYTMQYCAGKDLETAIGIRRKIERSGAAVPGQLAAAKALEEAAEAEALSLALTSQRVGSALGRALAFRQVAYRWNGMLSYEGLVRSFNRSLRRTAERYGGIGIAVDPNALKLTDEDREEIRRIFEAVVAAQRQYEQAKNAATAADALRQLMAIMRSMDRYIRNANRKPLGKPTKPKKLLPEADLMAQLSRLADEEFGLEAASGNLDPRDRTAWARAANIVKLVGNWILSNDIAQNRPLRSAESFRQELFDRCDAILGRYIQLSAREYGEIFSDYGMVREASKNELFVRRTKVNQALRLLSQIAAVERGDAPRRTGQQRVEGTDEQTDLERRLHVLLKELDPEAERALRRGGEPSDRFVKTPLQIWRDAAEKEIRMLETAIATGVELERNQIPLQLGEEELSLKELLELKRQRYREMFVLPKTEEEQVQAYLRQLVNRENALLAELDAARRGEFKHREDKNARAKQDSRVQALQREIAAIREEIQAERDLQGDALSTRNKRIKAVLNGIQRSMANANAWIENPELYFEQQERRRKSQEDIENDPAVKEARRAQREILEKWEAVREERAYKKLNALGKGVAAVGGLRDAIKVFLASGDISGVGVQCALAVLDLGPAEALKAIRVGIGALAGGKNAVFGKLSEGKTAEEFAREKFDELVKNNPFLREAVDEYGVHISTVEANGRYDNSEEGFARGYATRRAEEWMQRNLGAAGRAAKCYVDRSDRAFALPADILRLALCKKLADASAELKGGALTAAEKKYIGRIVNAATGRGDFFGHAGFSATLSRFFWAPARFSGQLQMLALPFTMLVHKDVSGLVKAAIARKFLVRTMANYGIAVMIAYLLKQAFGDDDDDGPLMETDPRSAKFGRINLGGRMFSLTGGLESYITLGARVLSGETKTKNGDIMKVGQGGDSRFGLVWRMFENKMTPDLNILRQMINKKKTTGERIEGFFGKNGYLSVIAGNSIFPLTVSDMVDVLKDDKPGLAEKAFLAGITVLGYNSTDFGYNDYDAHAHRFDRAHRALRDAKTAAERRRVMESELGPYAAQDARGEALRHERRQIDVALRTERDPNRRAALLARRDRNEIRFLALWREGLREEAESWTPDMDDALKRAGSEIRRMPEEERESRPLNYW